MKNTLKMFLGNQKAEKMTMGLIVAIFVLGLTSPVYATGAPALFGNSVKFLNSALTWVLLLTIPAAALMIAVQAIKKLAADGDVAVTAAANKAMKNTLIAGAIALSASGVAKAVLAFF